MNKGDIEVFLTIVDQGNIKQAANTLYLSPSTVGSRLKSLENTLGVKLIDRKKGIKEISLTSEGIKFLRIAKDLLISFNECENLNLSNEKHFISIASVDSMIGDGLAPLYRKIVYGEPNFTIDLKCYPADMIYSLVEQKRVHIGFALYNMSKKDISVKPLFSDNLVLIVPESSDIKGDITHTDNLDPSLELRIGRNDEIYMGWGPQYKMWHDRWFDNSITPIVTCSSVTFLNYFIEEGNFWSIVPRSVALGMSKRFGMRIVEIENAPPDRVCYQLTHLNIDSFIQKNIALFNKYLEEHLVELNNQGTIVLL